MHRYVKHGLKECVTTDLNMLNGTKMTCQYVF